MRNDRKKSKELNFRDRVDPIRFRKLLRFQKQRQGLFRLKVFPGTASDAARPELSFRQSGFFKTYLGNWETSATTLHETNWFIKHLSKRAVVVAKWLEWQPRKLEVLSSNPPGVRAFFSSSSFINGRVSLIRSLKCIFAVFPIFLYP